MKKSHLVIICSIFICCLVGILYFQYQYLSTPKKTTSVKNLNSKSTQAAPPLPTRISSVITEQLPSPFANIPTMQPSLNNETIPLAPKIPSGANLPNFSLRPDSPIANFDSNNQVRIIALIPASNHNGQAILSGGSDQVVVAEGERTQWGLITNITSEGLSINGKYISIDHKEVSKTDIKNVPIMNVPIMPVQQ